jgi:hypothetical protein
LTRSRVEADRLFGAAAALAAELHLALNADAGILDLSEPFESLGFRFERRERWQSAGGQPPRALDELSWVDAAVRGTAAAEPILAGEGAPSCDEPRAIVAGPDLLELAMEDGRLIARARRAPHTVALDPADVGTLVLLGSVDVPAAVADCFLERNWTVFFADESGRLRGVLAPESEGPDDPRILEDQVRLADQPDRVRGSDSNGEKRTTNFIRTFVQ